MADPGNPDQVDDGFGGFNSVLDGVTCEEWTCVPPLLGDFDWRDAVLYFVFVDRFVDGDPSNNGSNPPGVEAPAAYQGGDWAGVRQKVDEGYFNDLGVNALWLSVPADNTAASGIGDDGKLYSGYHGYWPSDLEATESRFGTLAELQVLVQAAHDKGLKVIVDYAMNHVHESAPVYAQHPEWFWPLGNCVCGGGCSWDGAEGKRCWFRDYLPDFNFTVPAARQFSVDNAIAWIQDTGIDGFRLDAVKHIEDSWILDLRQRVKDDIETVTEQHFYMVGETFTGDKGTIAYYVSPSTMLDGQFDFPLRHAIVTNVLMRSGTMHDLAGFLAGNDGYYGAGIMSTFVGNHDVPRSIHFAQDQPLWNDAWAGGKERAWSNQPGLPGEASAFERMANAFALIYTLPGVPLVYYGDEIGMAGAGDPDNRRFMQWSGYSAAQATLKATVTKLAQIRAEHPALRRGTRTTVSVTNETIAYRLTTAGDDVYVVMNRGDQSASAGGLPGGAFTDLMDGSAHSGPTISVPARRTRILVAP
jgi:glycosidase